MSDNPISYYVPLAYMEIKSSTVYPPLEYQPTSYIYDLNNNVDREKYINYVKWWDSNEDSDDFYKPITMSMKLIENIDKANPFYYESNEAVMKFNIKRATNNNTVPFDGENKVIYVGLNSYYYLSDFIKVGITNDNNNIKNNVPTGSYMYYNKNYNMYVINEIFDNRYQDICNNPDIYAQIFNPSLGDMNSDYEKIPYPIFKQSKLENDLLVFEDNKYDFNIHRISDINKLKLGNNSITEEIVIPNGNENIPVIDNDQHNILSSGISSNKDLFYIEFKNTFINNFCTGSFKKFNVIKLSVNPSSIVSSKNYTGASMTSQGSISRIAPIIRKRMDFKDNNNQLDYNDLITLINTNFGSNLSNSIISDLYNMYLSRTCEEDSNNIVYEFFEFKYDNICKLQIIIDITNQLYNSISKISLSPTNYTNIQRAYDDQLLAFLSRITKTQSENQTIYSFICTDTIYDNIFSQFEYGNSNITINS